MEVDLFNIWMHRECNKKGTRRQPGREKRRSEKKTVMESAMQSLFIDACFWFIFLPSKQDDDKVVFNNAPRTNCMQKR